MSCRTCRLLCGESYINSVMCWYRMPRFISHITFMHFPDIFSPKWLYQLIHSLGFEPVTLQTKSEGWKTLATGSFLWKAGLNTYNDNYNDNCLNIHTNRQQRCVFKRTLQFCVFCCFNPDGFWLAVIVFIIYQLVKNPLWMWFLMVCHYHYSFCVDFPILKEGYLKHYSYCLRKD